MAEAIELGVAIPLVTSALEQRFASREAENYRQQAAERSAQPCSAATNPSRRCRAEDSREGATVVFGASGDLRRLQP